MYSGPASGLWSSPNPFSAVPQGSLEVADNVVYTAPTVIEPRRGFEVLENSVFGTAESLANAIAFYGTNTLLAYDFTRIAIRPSTGGFFNWSETFAPNGNNRMRFEPAARSIFFNPSDGIRVFDGRDGFTTSAITDVSLRGITYSAGVGDLIGAGEVVGVDSGAAGEITPPAPAPDSDVSGVAFFSSIVAGPFISGENLTGDTGWSGVADSTDYPVIIIPLSGSTDFTVGRHVAGESSGATATIANRTVFGSDILLGLSTVVGTFVVETVAVSSTAIEPTLAGCPQGLYVNTEPISDDGWQSPNTAVAYRFTICRKDAFGRVIEGPPSGRTVARNIITSSVGGLTRAVTTTVSVTTDQPHGLSIGDIFELTPGEADFPAGSYAVTFVGGEFAFQYNGGVAGAGPFASTVAESFEITRAINVSCKIPQDSNESMFARVYRSDMTLTADADDVPSDELFQCYESPFFTSLELLPGFFSFQDFTPESLLEVPLYTNPNTGDGTLAANFRPPIAEDMAYWQNRMWFLNTTDKHSAQVSLIGVGSPDGIQVGDKIVFLVAGGVLGIDDVTFTAANPATTPGEFSVFSSYDPGTNIALTAQALVTAIDEGFPDAGVNAFYVSSEAGQPGMMLFQAREFGDAAGFSLYSSRPSAWTPQLPSNTAPLWPALVSVDNRHAARLCFSKLGQPEAVPLLNFEQIDADEHPGLKLEALNYRLIIFKTDGVYFVPTGFPVSLQKLSDAVLQSPDSVQRLGDAIYFLSDQGLMMVDDSGVRPASIQIDSTLTALQAPAALENLQQRTVGCAYRSAKMYLLWTIGRDDAGAFTDDCSQAFVRSTLSNGFTRFDFGVRAAMVDTSTDKLVVAPTVDNQLWVERKTLTATDYSDVNPEASDFDAIAINCEIRFNKLTNEEPATMKMAQQCSFLFKQNGINTINATFASEIHPANVIVAIETDGWGQFSWGEVPWGGFVRAIRRVQPLPPQVADCCQLSVGFTTSQINAKFAFLGIDVVSDGDTIANQG